MRKNKDGTGWEYVAVYVDDLLVVMKDARKFIEDILTSKHKYIIKGVGPPSYHLGADIYRDPDGQLAMGSKKYVEKILEGFERKFGNKPYKKKAPIPELDDSTFCSADERILYLSLVAELA